MIISKHTYQKTIEHLDEIQECCAQGIGNRNARDCLMDVSAIIYQIRKELADNLLLEEDD